MDKDGSIPGSDIGLKEMYYKIQAGTDTTIPKVTDPGWTKIGVKKFKISTAGTSVVYIYVKSKADFLSLIDKYSSKEVKINYDQNRY